MDQPGRWPPSLAFEAAVPFPQDTLVLGGTGVAGERLREAPGLLVAELTTGHTVSHSETEDQAKCYDLYRLILPLLCLHNIYFKKTDLGV